MSTSIEWVKNPDGGGQGITLNSKTGCLNGCDYCYARKLANGRLKHVYLRGNAEFAGANAYREGKLDPFYPRWWPQRLEQIRRIKKPTGIFLDDMSDWMADYWSAEYTEAELQVMWDCPQHRFYTLTKQPQNLQKWSFPENCWVGVTCTRDIGCTAALYYLQNVRATIKFLSLEPLLMELPTLQLTSLLQKVGINWLIIGACTGTGLEMMRIADAYKREDGHVLPHGNKFTLQPRAEWVLEIVQAADRAGVKVFLKDNLKPLLCGDALSGQASLDVGLLNWEGQLRQELPK